MGNTCRIIKQYIQDFIGNEIYDLIKFLLGLFITTVIGTKYKLLNLLSINIYLAVLISICVMFLFIITFIAIYRYFRKYKYHII